MAITVISSAGLTQAIMHKFALIVSLSTLAVPPILALPIVGGTLVKRDMECVQYVTLPDYSNFLSRAWCRPPSTMIGTMSVKDCAKEGGVAIQEKTVRGEIICQPVAILIALCTDERCQRRGGPCWKRPSTYTEKIKEVEAREGKRIPRKQVPSYGYVMEGKD